MTTTELDVYEPQQTPTLWGTDDPTDVVARASRAAEPLARVVETQKLFTQISGRKHVRVEGWTLLGSMLGVFPITVWSRRTEDRNGWEARVEARTRDGAVVGAAEAQCDRSEKTWASRDDYALRSMAQTRATSKALRQPLGFVMTLAGFDATPYEEMPRATADASTGRAAAGAGFDIDADAAEIIRDPAGNVFPDQRDLIEPQSPFQPPAGSEEKGKIGQPGYVTEPQHRNIRRLWKKLVDEFGATDEALRAGLLLEHGTEHTSELTKAQASAVITRFKEQAGE